MGDATKPTVIINVVGLSGNLLGENTPRLQAFSKAGENTRRVRPAFPALTCSAQSTYLTGLSPAQHGIVGNGWYFDELAQVWFWRQSNKLVAGEKLWEAAKKKDPAFTCANLFWWFNMYSSVDFAVTPRPIYRADGLKLPDIYTEPMDLRDELQKELGAFPLFKFWGPATSIESSQWIARAARWLHERQKPTLSLVYLPHLDYVLQKEGPNGPSVPSELRQIDAVCGELIDYFQAQGNQVVILSEYGINEVKGAVAVNRLFRERGWIQVRVEKGEEHFDAGASSVFAVVDHQIAHVYVKDAGLLPQVRKLLEGAPGIESILDREQQKSLGMDHARSGDLLLISTMDRWFSYEYWLDPKLAPDYARTVDIHRKPGYDPAELFVNSELRFPKLRVARRLAAKLLGFRYLMDVIGLDTSLVRGSHGRANVPEEYFPVLMTDRPDLLPDEAGSLDPLTIKDLMLRHLLDSAVG